MKKELLFNDILSVGLEYNASDWHIHQDKKVTIRANTKLIVLEEFEPFTFKASFHNLNNKKHKSFTTISTCK